jgi:cytochrome b pre-mRNA-processing protein 3
MAVAGLSRAAHALQAALTAPNIRQKLNGASTRPAGERPLSLLTRIFGSGGRDRANLRPLYEAVVAEGRDPAWYREGRVPDTIDGRFDMIAGVLALVLLRLEREGEAARSDAALLTETFIDDMDGTMRQLGIGDVVVGKRMGKLMGALGGRMGSFRTAEADGYDGAVRRNIFRDAPPSEDAVTFVGEGLRALAARLDAASLEQLLRGELGGA